MNFTELIGWSVSLSLHAWLLFPCMFGTDDSVEKFAMEDPDVFVTIVDKTLAPLKLAPPGSEREILEGDSWNPGEGEAGVSKESEPLPTSFPDISEDAVRALNLVLDLSDPKQFLRAAKDLGMRFLVYPPGKNPTWLLEVPGCNPRETCQLDLATLDVLSNRAHDLTPNHWYREIRNQAAKVAGVSPTGARIVATVPAGTDRMFLNVEQAWLEKVGATEDQFHSLYGSLRANGRGWDLAILRGE